MINLLHSAFAWKVPFYLSRKFGEIYREGFQKSVLGLFIVLPEPVQSIKYFYG